MAPPILARPPAPICALGSAAAATLSATVNPDFGQVEQDPAVLNLSVFETFFPEKRPFFLEDSRTFVPPYGLFQLFHSRRIGRAPGRLPLPEGDEEVDRPDETTIMGAAKVTGKSSAWTYGGLSAATGRKYAKVADANLRRQDRLIEPARRITSCGCSATCSVARRTSARS